MLFIDAFFRFSGVGLLLFLAVMGARDFRAWTSYPYLALACISVSALLLSYLPDALRPPGPLYAVLLLINIPHLVFVWLLALSLFDKGFTLQRFHIGVGLIYCWPMVWLRAAELGWISAPAADVLPWLILYGSLTSAVLMIHLCTATLRGRADDLNSRRRLSRIYFVVVIAVVAIFAAATDIIPPAYELIDKRTAKAMVIWPAIVWGAVWMLTFHKTAVTFASRGASRTDLDPRDQALKEKLLTQMAEGALYRDPSLTIPRLAAKLGVSQHKLRALINDGLGYPNFSVFINEYRVEAVKAALIRPDQARASILTLALDSGFKSLSSFNRAFKSEVGVTPSTYRKAGEAN